MSGGAAKDADEAKRTFTEMLAPSSLAQSDQILKAGLNWIGAEIRALRLEPK
jgi:hypothetical protein